MMVRGHTDGFGFAGGKTRNNWTLSAERAEATRALFESANIGADRFVRIEGAADTEPNVAGNPYDARNRRVSVTLQSEPRAAAD
jgi:chemotaxis protein MotB